MEAVVAVDLVAVHTFKEYKRVWMREGGRGRRQRRGF